MVYCECTVVITLGIVPSMEDASDKSVPVPRDAQSFSKAWNRKCRIRPTRNSLGDFARLQISVMACRVG